MVLEEQLAELRNEYAKVEKIDPSSILYDNLCQVLDEMDDDKLRMLADAKIKWLSMLANTRLTRRKMGIK